MNGEQEQQKERELADLKQELEAKDCLYKQALFDLDHHQKNADELSSLLRNCDLQKQFYLDKCLEANARISEMEENISESKKVQEQLLTSQNRLQTIEAEFDFIRKARAEAILQAEAVETALREERQKMETQLNTIHDLEDQLRNKSAHIALLQLELSRANELCIKFEEDLNLQAKRIELLEAELGEHSEKEKVQAATLKLELHIAKSRLPAAEERSTRDNNDNISNKEGTNMNNLEKTKKELELAVSKNGLLRIKAEQATSRAEAAEKANAALKEEIRRIKE